MGAARRFSDVFLSFSPAKLSAAMTEAVNIGIVRNIGPRTFIAKKYMKDRLFICDGLTPLTAPAAILEAMLGAAWSATYTVRNGSAIAKNIGTPIIGP